MFRPAFIGLISGVAVLVAMQPANALTYKAEVMADNPIIYYEFESGTAANTGSLGPAAGGSFVNSVTTFQPSAFAAAGNAVALTGGYIDVPSYGTYGQLSIETWLNPDAIGGLTSLYSTDSFGSGNHHFNVNGNRSVTHAISNGNPNDITTGTNLIQNGQWYHVVGTYDATAGGATKLYINGAEVQSANHNNAPFAALGDAQVGAWNGSRILDGSIDEFAVYSSVLSADRVLAHYSASLPPPSPPSGYEVAVLADNPLVYYRFEETSGATTANDSSGNSNHGVYVGPVGLGSPSADIGLGTAAEFFNGSPDTGVSVPALGTQNQLTLEVWLRPESANFDAIYNTDGFPSGALHTHLTSDGRLAFTINNPSSDDRNLGLAGAIPLDQWSMVNVTYNADTEMVELFLNGLFVGSATYLPGDSLPANLAAAHIGIWNGSREFDGFIDEFAIFDQVLNADQIAAHYAARNLAAAPAAVPEPTTAVLSLLVTAALSRRRRRSA